MTGDLSPSIGDPMPSGACPCYDGNMMDRGETEPKTPVGTCHESRSVVARLAGMSLIALVRLYQVTLSPWLGSACRFQPTCSNYMIGAVQKYGALCGGWRGVLRICRCHPFRPGGYDPP
jgi:uncharacterized protein